LTQVKAIAPWAAVLVVAVIVTASIALLTSALRTQRAAGEETRRHFENVLTLRRTRSLLVDAETGQRGFLLTADPRFLEPYRLARADLPAVLSLLYSAGIAAPGDRLDSLSQAKLRELAETIALVRAGRRDAAITRVASGPGKSYMDELRAETGRRIGLQTAQLDAAIRRSEEYTVRIYRALALLVVVALFVLWLGLRMMLRTQRLEAEAVRLHEVEEAQRQTALIARELNHRVKNLFSVVLAIVQLASRGAASPRETVDRIRDRVQALANAHELSLGNDPMGGFDFETMVRAILAAYVSETCELELSGPPLRLPAMRATPLGLILFELATNAMKYGAWSTGCGKVAVRWSIENGQHRNGAHMLHFQWVETRSEPLLADGAEGFGSRLINSAVAQLGGSIVRERRSHGHTILIDAPIAPAPAALPQSELVPAAGA
jgi:two-component sensor histidine kinase